MSSEFDDVTIAIMTGAAGPGRVSFVTSTSRLSRNIGKLPQILEFLLGNGAAVPATNYLLRRDEAFLRRAIVQVDARALSPRAHTSGLSDTHRKTYEAISRPLVGAADQQRLAVSMVFE
jgi:hypothetical protein